MNRITRIFVFLLVFLIAVTTLITPASATTVENIEPYAETGICPMCGGVFSNYGYKEIVKSIQGPQYFQPCEYSELHNHKTTESYTLYTCKDCSYEYKKNHKKTEYCPITTVTILIFGY